jgi:hypothetical protein
MTARVERTFRGISERLAVHYLEGLGGERADEDRVAGEGWTASLSTAEVTVGPSLSLTEVRVVFEGDPDALEDLVPAFAQKAMRAGG